MLRVNYIRRYLDEVQEIAALIAPSVVVNRMAPAATFVVAE